MRDFNLFLEAADSNVVTVHSSDLPWFFRSLVQFTYGSDVSKLKDGQSISEVNGIFKITKRTKEAIDEISKWKVLKVNSANFTYQAEQYAIGLGYSIGRSGNFSAADNLIIGSDYKTGNFIMSPSSEILDDIKDYISNLRRVKSTGRKNTKEYLKGLFGDVDVKALREPGRFSISPDKSQRIKLVVYVDAEDDLTFDNFMMGYNTKLTKSMIDGFKKVFGL